MEGGVLRSRDWNSNNEETGSAERYVSVVYRLRFAF